VWKGRIIDDFQSARTIEADVKRRREERGRRGKVKRIEEK
jgi:hypothetical protein